MELLLVKKDMAIFPDSPFVILDQKLDIGLKVYATEIYQGKVDFISLRGTVSMYMRNSSQSSIRLSKLGRPTTNMELEI